MTYIPQMLFMLLALIAGILFVRNMRVIFANIRLGRPMETTAPASLRWRNLLLYAVGQKKMFRKPLVAVLHLVIYASFFLINIEILEIVADGALGTHRVFAPYLGSFYTFLINFFEYFAVGVILACLVFLARRNLLRIGRFRSRDLNGWPRRDANYILLAEIALMLLFLTMNGTDTLLRQRGWPGYTGADTGSFQISSLLLPLFEGLSGTALVATERTAWWMHIAGIFAFMNYLPYSKHLHILLGFPNAYYTRTEPMSKMRNMPEVHREVEYAFRPETASSGEMAAVRFGARDVTDLSRRNLLDAYSCTECGRCSAACPATQTGKALSPRKIMMDTRDRMEELGRKVRRNGKPEDDGKSLLHDYISTEELWACTSCAACVQECPVNIHPLEIILELRRSLIMEESRSPQEWTVMNANIETNFSPWKFAPEDRDAWIHG